MFSRRVVVAFALVTGCASIGRDSPSSPPAFEGPTAVDPLAAADPSGLSPYGLSPSLAGAPVGRVAGVAEPGSADLDPGNDALVGPPSPVPDCESRLRAADIAFRRSELPLKIRGNLSCGSDQVVEYLGSGSGIRYNLAPVLTCTMALGLASFERVLQEEARSHLGTRVKRLVQAGTYSCRRMARYASMISEHSYANAIDVKSLVLEDGRSIAVVKDFGPLENDPPTPEGRFLRTVARRAFDEKIFSVVLTPRYDALHRDHFHLDMARYRVDGTR
jgi:hypothetical protein